jgi:hypothetical protein
MDFYEELEKIASSVEKNGFVDDRIEYGEKIVSANALLNKLAEEIDSPISENLTKEASFGSKLMSGLGQTAIVGLSVAVAGRAVDSLERKYDKRAFDRDSGNIIEFAKRENPSLEHVSNGKMKAWLNSAYTVSPRVAKDPMLATSFLSTAHAVNGVDLNTAKTIADVQRKGGKDYSKSYDAIRGSSSGLGNAIMSLE